MSQSEEGLEASRLSDDRLSEENDDQLKAPSTELETVNCPSVSCLSIKSGKSMDYPMKFKTDVKTRGKSSTLINVCLENDGSGIIPVGSKQGSLSEVDQPTSEDSTHQSNLDSVFMTLEKDTIICVKNELKNLHGLLNRERLNSQAEDEETLQEERKKRSKQAILDISLHFLRIMNHGELADELLHSDFLLGRSEDSGDTPLSSSERLSEEHGSQAASGRIKIKGSLSASPGCGSLTSDRTAPVMPPSPSCMSMKSDKSMDYPMKFREGDQKTTVDKSDKSTGFPVGLKGTAPDTGTPYNPSPSCMSTKSDKSMDYPMKFKQSEQKMTVDKSDESMGHPVGLKGTAPDTGTPSNPSPSCMSMKSDKSMDYPMKFNVTAPDTGTPYNPSPSCMSMKSDKSMDYPMKFKQAVQKTRSFPPAGAVSLQRTKSMDLGNPPNYQVHQRPNLDTIFKILEETIVAFVRNELRNFHELLNPENLQIQNKDQTDICEGEEKTSVKEAFLNLTLELLCSMKQQEIAASLQNKYHLAKCHCKLKSNLRKKFAYVFEGIAKSGNPTLLNEIYTELYITEGKPSEVNSKHEVKLIERAHTKPVKPEKTVRCEDIFKPVTRGDTPIRTVITEGVAGIGKTVLTQKFILDWAEGRSNQDIQFTFLFSFRELNILKMKEISLAQLIHLFFPETKEGVLGNFEGLQVLFIFDGLDECRFQLNLNNNDILEDATQPSSLDALLTNLIKGRLLPSARIWITTRPAAAHHIPAEFVDLVTEVRGFNNPQKEEYFRKRFREEEESRRIISHLKTSRSLHIMCHIPVFCWITATVLEDTFKSRTNGDLPTSLTEMYVYFLVVLTRVKNVKYSNVADPNLLWTPETSGMIQSLGKLAFEQLMTGNLFFYKSDLAECGIDVHAALVYSGVFTEIFKEERGLFEETMFCFVHLTIQEFLAALHVHLTFINTGVNLLAEEDPASLKPEMSRETMDLFYQSAIDKTLETPKGRLHLVLRFLLGLSLETSQTLLRGLIADTETELSSSQNTVQYIKKKIVEIRCLHQRGNLFHCLDELKDYSLAEEIQQTLKSGKLTTHELSPAILLNTILSSEEHLEEFDLKKYSVTEEGQLALLPLLTHSIKAVLSYLNLTERTYDVLIMCLQTSCATVRDLDLSNNDLQDSGVKLLCEGFCSTNCKLEALRLSGCLITKEGCAMLASALSSNPSHLKELDLSYNHPEESGVKLFSAGLKDPSWALQTLKTEPRGTQFLKPGLNKYACELVLDLNTAHRNIKLSNNRTVTIDEENQAYPDHPERSDALEQLLCRDGLTGRCYWEVEWRGRVSIGVACRALTRKEESDDHGLGMNDQSWTLLCSEGGLSVCDGNKITPIHGDASSRVGVYLDMVGGILSFFGVSLDKKTHLHSFNRDFSESVYPAFGIATDSSLSLC